MRQRTVEAVESTRVEHRKEITRLEEDRQHFVSALAESINEVTRLRTKHLDYGEWEDGDEHYDEGAGNDNLDHWYRDETGYPDAAGVGAFYYDERVRRAAAPLKGPQTTTDSCTGPTDFVSAATKAAQAAATAAT